MQRLTIGICIVYWHGLRAPLQVHWATGEWGLEKVDMVVRLFESVVLNRLLKASNRTAFPYLVWYGAETTGALS